MVMTRKTVRDLRSIPENEVEVEDADDDKQNMMKYVKPVILCLILETNFKNNPYFLRKCLNYEIQAKKQNKSNSDDVVIFNYMDHKNKILNSEAVIKFACPFCVIPWRDIKSLEYHLKSSHRFFDFEVLEKEDKRIVDVKLSPDAFRLGELEYDLEIRKPFMFCSKVRKERLRDYFNNVKPLKIRLLEMEQPETSLAGEMRARAHSSEKNSKQSETAQSPEKTSSIILTTKQRAIIAQSSELKVPRVSKRKQLYAERKEAKRIDNLKKRKLYHSQIYQPMSSEEVLADKDSEDEADDETADREERMRLDRLKDVSKEEKQYMCLWNIFVRKQRVIADGHMSWACEKFTKLHKKEMMSSLSFIWWWRVFMTTLWNHGLICPLTIDNCNTILREPEAEAPATTQAEAPTTTQAEAPATNQAEAPANGNEQQKMEVDEEQQYYL